MPDTSATAHAARRVRSLAFTGQASAWGSVALIGCAVLWYCMDQGRFNILVSEMLPATSTVIGERAWHLGMLVVGAMYGLFVWTMSEVANLFRLFGQGDLISNRVTQGLQRLGYAAIAGGIGTVAGKVALGLALSWESQPGLRQVAVSVSSSDLLAVVAAIMFMLFARIVAEAGRAIAENQGFV